MRSRKLLPTSLVIALSLVLASCGGGGGGGESPNTPTSTPVNNNTNNNASDQNTNNSNNNANNNNTAVNNIPNLNSLKGDIGSLGRTFGSDSPFSGLGIASGHSTESFDFSSYQPESRKVTDDTIGEDSENLNYSSSGIVTGADGLAIVNSYYSSIEFQNNQLNQAFYSFGGTTNEIAQQVYPYNTLSFFGEGFIPVLAGKGLMISSVNQDGRLTFASPLQNPGRLAFTGEGVRSALVDGGFDPDFIANVWPKNPIQINLENLPNYGRNYSTLSASEEHGFQVASIIGAYRDTSNVGITPDTDLYYAQINAAGQYIGQIYLNTYDQSHPVVINNSIAFPYAHDANTDTIYQIASDSSTGTISNANLKTLVAFSKSTQIFNSIYAGIKAVLSRRDAPLFVFSAGNYAPESVVPVIRNAFKNNLSGLYNFVNKPNAGIHLNASTALAKLVSDPETAKGLIVVTGDHFDPLHTMSRAQYKWKYDYLLTDAQKATARKNGILVDPDNYKVTPVTNIDKKDYNDQYISAIGAYQCGVTKFSCLTVNYRYFFPKKYNAITKHNKDNGEPLGYNTGTSFAAPVVSAVAIMLKQQYPWFSAQNLKDTILTTATDIGAPGVDDIFGWGVLNAGNALKGPAMFAFGDFQANLENRDLSDSQVKAGTPYNLDKNITKNLAAAPEYKAYNSYFTNSISGDFGLHVTGTNKDYLYLTGNNTFKGQTVVDSGNLVVVSPAVIGINNTYQAVYVNNNYAALTSNTYINNHARFYSYYSSLGNVINNGVATLVQSKVNGNLTIKKSATLYLGVPNASNIKGKTAISYSPVVVSGTANLAGTLGLTDSDQLVVDGKIGSSQGDAFIPVQGKNQIILVADKIEGEFDNHVIPTTSAFKSFKINYSTDRKAVAVNVSVKDTDAVLETASIDLDKGDKQTITQGTVVINHIFDQANNFNAHATDGESIAPTPGSDTPIVIGGDRSTHAHSASGADSSSLGGSIDDGSSIGGGELSGVITTRTNQNTDAKGNVIPESVMRQSAQVASLLLAQEADKVNANNTAPKVTEKPVGRLISKWEAVAGRIESLTLKQYQDLLVRSAATVYADAQQANSQLGLAQVTDFTATATDRFLSSDHSVKAYGNYGLVNTKWSNADTKVFGQQKIQTFNTGLYGQTLSGINYGFLVNYNTGDWSESNSLVSDTNNQLGQVKLTNIGGALTLGQGFSTSFYSFSAFANYQNYDVTRASFFSSNDQKAKFNAFDAGVSARAGTIAYGTTKAGIALSSGVNLLAHYQAKVNETATGINPTYSSTFSLNTDARTTFVASFDVGAKFYNHFTLFNRANSVELLINVKGIVTHNEYALKLGNNITGRSFNNRMITSAKLNYNLNLFSNLDLNVSGDYSYATDWNNAAGKVGFTYSF